MRRKWALRALRFALLAVVIGAVVGAVTMQLWNWLMPSLFGLHVIDFWQALGLLLLARFLFGGFRGRGYGGGWRRRMAERWEQMTPEEREKFRQGMQRGCGSFTPPSEIKV